MGPGAWAALGALPSTLYLAHLAFGANQTVAALWLTVLLAVGLALALAIPSARIGLFDLRPMTPVAILFACVIGVALWSLTPSAPGGPHSIWAWAGLAPGASTVDRSATLVEILKLLGLACAFLIGCLQSARADRARATFDLVVYLGAAYAAVSLLTFISAAQVMNTGRLSGGFLSPNSAATVFGVLTVLGLTALMRGFRRSAGLGVSTMISNVAPAAACTLLFATCLLLTASRMGLAATAVACGILILWEVVEARGRRLPILIGGIILLLVGVVLLLGGNDLVWRRTDTLHLDTAVRASVFSAHWDAFRTSPLMGYGLGSFDKINHLLMTSETYGVLWNVRATHNVYLQWLEEAGILGAAPMFLLIAAIIGIALRQSLRLRSGQGLMRGLLVSNLVVLIHGTTDFALQVPSIAAFWALLLGIQFAFGQSRHERFEQDDPVVKPSTQYRLKLTLAGALALTTLISATAAALATSQTAFDIPFASDLAPAREARARSLAERPDADTETLKTNAAILRTSPLNTDAYLRQAYIQTRHGAPLNPASLDALARSYSVEPFGAGSAHWRIGFLLERWPQLSPSLRQQVSQELEALIMAGRPFKPTSVSNPSGRLAAVLLDAKARRARATKRALAEAAVQEP
ncbi:O-antigen ligase family protein [Brevundimonas sp.]|uniref:O-antigen ligase family protein n=1 Tax=Brevundimonas sp. TaxID=1871086 RepID=UPI003BADBD82